jgi:multimeric flavodoxin WrbA
MKVVAFNGSPKKEGNTYHAIRMVADELEKQGITVEIIHVGNKTLKGCTACGECAINKDDKCIIPDDEVNEWIGKMKEADGIILGTPVHFASMGATLKTFLDRALYVLGRRPSTLRYKVGASVVAVRRSGGVSTFHEMNNYFTYFEMLMPASNYWNVIHGRLPGEVAQDAEGVQIMRILGKNMAWLMKVLEYGKGAVATPEIEEKIATHFIR